MTAPHDTPETVEAMDHNLRSWCVTSTNEAAAMLRRLHKRATDAERERDQWIANSRENKLIAESNLRERDELLGLLVTHEICADRIKATARADALREAASVCRQRLISRSYGSHADAYEYAMNAILALIKKETPDAE